MGRGSTQEPQCQFIYLFLHGCHNLYFRRNHVTVLLHQNLPQSKDVENILGTICFMIADTIVADSYLFIG